MYAQDAIGFSWNVQGIQTPVRTSGILTGVGGGRTTDETSFVVYVSWRDCFVLVRGLQLFWRGLQCHRRVHESCRPLEKVVPRKSLKAVRNERVDLQRLTNDSLSER